MSSRVSGFDGVTVELVDWSGVASDGVEFFWTVVVVLVVEEALVLVD